MMFFFNTKTCKSILVETQNKIMSLTMNIMWPLLIASEFEAVILLNEYKGVWPSHRGAENKKKHLHRENEFTTAVALYEFREVTVSLPTLETKIELL